MEVLSYYRKSKTPARNIKSRRIMFYNLSKDNRRICGLRSIMAAKLPYNMNEIVKIREENGKQAVSARELYQALGYDNTQFSRWAKKQIVANPYAVENEDWVGFDINVEGNIVLDYALTIDFAKKCCMLSKTVVGEKVRNYFIEVEKAAKQLSQTADMQIEEMMIRTLQKQLEQKKRLEAVESDVKKLKAQTSIEPDWWTIMGYARWNGMSINVHVASKYGKKATRRCKELGYTPAVIPDPRFGQVNTYPVSILNEVFAEPIM